MSTNKEEYKKIQGQILKHLFDKAKADKFTEITALTKKPESEAQYHCDVLTEQGLIASERVSVGSGRFAPGYTITALGRKIIMEQ
jgi:DNA-binding IclR family transcriptional regulator